MLKLEAAAGSARDAARAAREQAAAARGECAEASQAARKSEEARQQALAELAEARHAPFHLQRVPVCRLGQQSMTPALSKGTL